MRRKAKRGVVQRHVEALEDVDEILECYRRIKGHLERLMVSQPVLTSLAIVEHVLAERESQCMENRR